jgi:hypothetical protein
MSAHGWVEQVFGPALACPGLGCVAVITPHDVRRMLLGTTATPDADSKTLWAAYEAAYAEAEEVRLKSPGNRVNCSNNI